jgi:hypothetical protein
MEQSLQLIAISPQELPPWMVSLSELPEDRDVTLRWSLLTEEDVEEFAGWLLEIAVPRRSVNRLQGAVQPFDRATPRSI